MGVGRVARATPDGYTFGIGQVSSNAFNGAVYKLPYDLLKDFEPVALLTVAPMWILGKNALPANDVTELIAEGERCNRFGRSRRHGACRISAASTSRTTPARASRSYPIAVLPQRTKISIAGHILIWFCPEASNTLATGAQWQGEGVRRLVQDPLGRGTQCSDH